MVSTGVESAPGDILAWSIVKRVREDLSSDTRELQSCFYKLKYVLFLYVLKLPNNHELQNVRA